MSRIKFSQLQAEGVAKVMDNLGTAALIAAVVGFTGHSQTTPIEHFWLVTVGFTLPSVAFFLRRN